MGLTPEQKLDEVLGMRSELSDGRVLVVALEMVRELARRLRDTNRALRETEQREEGEDDGAPTVPDL